MNETAKEYLDSSGKPLEVGHVYSITTHDNFGYPKPQTEWYKAKWNGTQLVDVEDGCTWTEWLEQKGEVSPDVVY